MGDREAGDEDLLARERVYMVLEAAGMPLRRFRTFHCSTCHRPLAVLFRPEVEVITEDDMAVLHRLAEQIGAVVPDPYSDPADVLVCPDCPPKKEAP